MYFHRNSLSRSRSGSNIGKVLVVVVVVVVVGGGRRRRSNQLTTALDVS